MAVEDTAERWRFNFLVAIIVAALLAHAYQDLQWAHEAAQVLPRGADVVQGAREPTIEDEIERLSQAEPDHVTACLGEAMHGQGCRHDTCGSCTSPRAALHTTIADQVRTRLCTPGLADCGGGASQ